MSATSLSFLTDALHVLPSWQRLCAAVDNGAMPVVCTGLSGVHKALVIAALRRQTGFPVAVVTDTEAAAVRVCEDLRELGTTPLHFPARDYALGGFAAESKEYEYKRVHTLAALADGAFDVAVMSVEAFCGRTISPQRLAERTFTVRAGQTLPPDQLVGNLLKAGYVAGQLVEAPGQFARRGGLVDVFPVDADGPFRVEYWGDEIDTLAAFDTVSQRRAETVKELRIAPAGEVIATDEELAALLRDLLKTARGEDRVKRLQDDLTSLEQGLPVAADRYAPLLDGSFSCVADYLTDALFVVCESANTWERYKNLTDLFAADVTALLENGCLDGKTTEFYLSKGGLLHQLDHSVILDNFPRGRYETPPRTLADFDWKLSSPWSGDLDVLCEDLNDTLEQNGAAVVLVGQEKGARALCEDLAGRGIAASCNAAPSLPRRGVVVCTGHLSGGFEIPLLPLAVITSKTGTVSAPSPAKAKRRGISSLDELQVGDHVVHTVHGIGLFCGVRTITASGVTKDYLMIRYAGQDVLYVPVTQMDLVARYSGGDTEHLRLNKLGSSDWQRTRKRVRRAVRDMAKELTALYAARMASPGYAFGPDTDLQNNFERRFPYEETADQLRCVNEIKADMERESPMDRLLCGDVGFGKTEVALRAAFKCICEGKQCAILVPTTILAWQHYHTALSRIGDLPVNVRLLSRFVSPKEQARTIKDLRAGTVDLVVGTHRLISKDVTFKDLGLVVIDEEQRFGVAQKEKLKELYPYVDVLTLSATPIPRTLNMAMSGLRDMSVIEEPPGQRHPVQTYVMEQSTGILLEAIRKELRRGGQVYYLHNRVESIGKVAARLQANLPDAAIEVAHGQMGEEELSAVWKRLMERSIDVLVCTTIIETGVDVPNVNTLIIEDADRMGLSQLHQLRGRVGRSSRRAYAYFCFRPGRVLNEEAAKRLQAIRQFTQFGAGFRIAMRDLEIRGAGSVLGGAQHGNMEAVGYDMYLQLLREAMEQTDAAVPPDGNEPEDKACTIDLNVNAHIPETYIESDAARMGVYKRIADIRCDEDAEDVIDELCDRFGEPDAAVMGLIDIALLRNKAAAHGVTEITKENADVVLRQRTPDSALFLQLGGALGDRVRYHTTGRPCITVRMKPGQRLSDTVSEIVSVL